MGSGKCCTYMIMSPRFHCFGVFNDICLPLHYIFDYSLGSVAGLQLTEQSPFGWLSRQVKRGKRSYNIRETVKKLGKK